jgi:alginate O-acetyltransferase complex protein AlgI
MLFNSFQFLIFFIVVTSLYFAVPFKKRWIILLLASCYFYMSFVPIYILILGFTIVIDYFAAIYIDKTTGTKRKLFLVYSLMANIGILVIFKYYNFLNANLDLLLRRADVNNPFPYLSILLPIGLSFHTFQAMSYTIEVYRGNFKPERNFGIYSLYVMFYPQLVAGPIERPQNLLHQFREKYDFDYDRVTSGLRLMLWGLFKKAVIADRLAQVVDVVYKKPSQFNCVSLAIATLFFAYEIFCDFSGYTDMAIGAARVMGFKLMINFNNPYHSKSVAEFWKRWHISLSSWFRTYLYLPLGGSRVAMPRWFLNLFIVFLISGLWHGANWTFVIWGALHCFYMIFGHLTNKIRNKTEHVLFKRKLPVLSIITTFCLVSFAWIFFRADSLSNALYISSHIFTDIPSTINRLISGRGVRQDIGMSNSALLFSIILIISLEFFQYIRGKVNISEVFLKWPQGIRWSIYYVTVFGIIIFGVFQNRQFIYFQF